MSLYGNILTLFSTNAAEIAGVEQLLKNNNVPYRAKENTFYIGTEKKAQTRDLERKIATVAAIYVFHHIGISDGSMTRGKGLDLPFIDGIEDIFNDYE